VVQAVLFWVIIISGSRLKVPACVL